MHQHSVKSGIHYATMVALVISNLTVLGLAILIAGPFFGGSLGYFAAVDEMSKVNTAGATSRQPATQSAYEASARVIDSTDKNELKIEYRVTNTGKTTIRSFEVAGVYIAQDVRYVGSTVAPNNSPSSEPHMSVLWSLPTADLMPGKSWATVVTYAILAEPRHSATYVSMHTRLVNDGTTYLPESYSVTWHQLQSNTLGQPANPPQHGIIMTNKFKREWTATGKTYHEYTLSVKNSGNIAFAQLPVYYTTPQGSVYEYFFNVGGSSQYSLPLPVPATDPNRPLGFLYNLADESDLFEPGEEWVTDITFELIGAPSTGSITTVATGYDVIDINGWGYGGCCGSDTIGGPPHAVSDAYLFPGAEYNCPTGFIREAVTNVCVSGMSFSDPMTCNFHNFGTNGSYQRCGQIMGPNNTQYSCFSFSPQVRCRGPFIPAS